MYVIKNGLIYTMGTQGIVRGDILVEHGKIVSAGEEINISDAQVLDASGKYVVPGFVDAHSHIGTMKGSVDQDANELTDPLTPQLDIYMESMWTALILEAQFARELQAAVLRLVLETWYVG